MRPTATEGRGPPGRPFSARATALVNWELTKGFLEKDPKTKGKVLGDVLISLMIPPVGIVQPASDRNEQVHNNLYIAFALAAYRRERGHYPKKLDALAPKYLVKIPADLFSGRPLVYHRAENGYLLYSVGVNDGGDPPADGLSVRMPLPRLPKK
jgi:hypothetical protein